MQQDLSTLNRQAIDMAREYTGAVAWPTVLLTAAVIAGVVLTLGAFASGALSLWLAIPLYAALTYMSYTPLHEAAHGNIHGGRDNMKWLNDLCGYLVAPIIMVPYASHTVEHFTHHRYTNQDGKDPDYVISNMAKGPVAMLVTVFQFMWVQNSFFAQKHWVKATVREQVIYVMEIAFSVGWRIAFIALVARPDAALVIGASYVIGGLFTAYWFAYRPHIPYQDSTRYRNTNSLIMPRWMKPFEWFWLGQNLHSVHHLFPRVPFYRYHALHREIEPIMRAHGTPIVGVFSRKPV